MPRNEMDSVLALLSSKVLLPYVTAAMPQSTCRLHALLILIHPSTVTCDFYCYSLDYRSHERVQPQQGHKNSILIEISCFSSMVSLIYNPSTLETGAKKFIHLRTALAHSEAHLKAGGQERMRKRRKKRRSQEKEEKMWGGATSNNPLTSHLASYPSRIPTQ